MITDVKKKSSIPMPKVHSKIPSFSKENVKVNTKSPEKVVSNISTPDDTNVKKRKLSRIISTTSKADTSISNIRPTKFPRKSISQTSKLYRPRASLSATSNTSIHKTTTTTSTLSNIKTPSSSTSTSPRNSFITKNSPRSTLTKTPLSKTVKSETRTSLSRTIKSESKTPLSRTIRSESKTPLSRTVKSETRTSLSRTIKSESNTKPLTVHKTPSTIKKNVASKSFLKTKNTSLSTNSTDASAKKASKPPKSKYGVTLTKRPRRSGWDTKGLLEDAKKDILELTNHIDKSCKLLEQKDEELNEKSEQINQLQSDKEKNLNEIETIKSEKEKEKKETEEILKTKECEINDLKEKNTKLEDTYGEFVKEHDKLKEKQKILIDEHTKLKEEFDELTKNHKVTSEELEKAKETIKDLKQKLEDREQKISDFEKQVANFKLESQVNKKYIKELESTKNDNGEIIKDLEIERERHLKRLEALEDDYSEAKKNIQELEEQRRFLHNEIQELKGNIRVFCRVRPVLESEKEKYNLSGDDLTPHIVYPKDNDTGITLVQQTESAMGSASSKSYPFSFDRIFNGESKQEEIFTEIAQLVQSALDGYNVCIFAYGQTGSGKTYTMEGGEDEETMGMIPRAVKQIFIASEEFKKKGWIYDIDCQFLEIYNETIRDLLGNDETQKHEIKHLSYGRTIVTDAKIVKVTTSNEVHKLLQIASKNRSTGATLCNERSSRSHSIFTLHLSGHNVYTDERYESSLNLIDLAGSERLAVSGATGDRLKETRAINKSLSCLSDVIAALCNNEPHIPYRNSKLTYLLQNSLGGNSKTLMFVNISPLFINLQETLCSLRFATKVNSCQIGTAKNILK
jgi:kinesin family protein C1